jgi:hypothetical protein
LFGIFGVVENVYEEDDIDAVVGIGEGFTVKLADGDLSLRTDENIDPFEREFGGEALDGDRNFSTSTAYV